MSPTRTAVPAVSFPVGYRSFHPDPSINFELNRWLGALPEEELWAAAPRIASLADWTAVMLELAERAEREERARAAAFYYRAVEFFLDPAHPDKDRVYRRFLDLFARSAEGLELERHRIPYLDAWLPAIELPAAGRPASARPRDTLLLHGGFDSLQEELLDWGLYFAAAGYRVVLFEGPGQGAPLRDHGLVMRPDWERPVAAVLDHLRIERATLFGISLGGYLAPRAAAHEPRVERVVVCDVLDDFYDCFATRAGAQATAMLEALLARGARAEVNALLGRTMEQSAATRWAFRHGMQVSGAADPWEFVLWLREMATASFSHRVTQDVLLLAGADDHIVPLHQLWRQAAILRGARSVTTRLFTAVENASSHCQIGNVGLALAFVRSWLDFQADGRS
jgi:pimeloyl-ACP methyl ester carboxylesterase